MNVPLAVVEPLTAADSTALVPYVAQPPFVSTEAVDEGRWRRWSRTLRGAVAQARQWIRSLGPYVAIELLLPGGTIIALALWAYRQRRSAPGRAVSSRTAAPEPPRAPLHCVTPCVQR